jgi:replicative superfamily II helicase
MKSMREALRAMREEARKHEKVTIDLEKKHEEEMRQVMEEKYRLEIGASHAFDEVLRKVKRITIVDEDSNDHL